jgi:ribonuclease HI
MSSDRTIKDIYTDGACSGNPGPGGWGTVVYFSDGSVHEIGGADAATTNNRMEMQAAVAALQYLREFGQKEPINLYTDSEYLKNGITKWIHGWKKKDWKTAAGKPVLNQDLWQAIDRLNTRQVIWQYVRGHAGNEGNERCDAIARAFSLGRTPNLRQLSPTSSPTPTSSIEDAELLSDSTDKSEARTIQSNFITDRLGSEPDMMEPTNHSSLDALDELPREVRVAQLRNMVETLRIADEVASQGYLITSSELADLMDINASAVTSRGDNWVWRNWVVSRVRREGNQILWQLERID